MIVSGINGGLNAGINVLYSGTVSAALEGSFFGILSIAVSLEFEHDARFDAAADIAVAVIEQILAHKSEDQPQMYNLNIPTSATDDGATPEIHIVPMGLGRYGQDYVKRTDPKNRTYYWTSGDPPPQDTQQETDLNALRAGYVTLTPLQFNLTHQQRLQEMQSWKLEAPERA